MDMVSTNDVAGQAYLHLAKIPKLHFLDSSVDQSINQLLDLTPTVTVALQLFTEAKTGPYQVEIVNIFNHDQAQKVTFYCFFHLL